MSVVSQNTYIGGGGDGGGVCVRVCVCVCFGNMARSESLSQLTHTQTHTHTVGTIDYRYRPRGGKRDTVRRISPFIFVVFNVCVCFLKHTSKDQGVIVVQVYVTRTVI